MENFRNTTLKIIIRPLSQKRYFTESRRKLHGGKASVLPLKSIRKTNRGKFTSQYALSERLVCGNCGCYYRRVTWNIHGRKQIVWRCISRLEFGKEIL